MGNLTGLQSILTATQATSFTRGIVVAPPPGGTGYSVNVAGSTLAVSAAESCAVAAGDSVLVALVNSGIGQAEAIVLCRLSTTGIHPATGTVTAAPAAPNPVSITGADGVAYSAYALAGYTAAVNDNVELIFLAGTAYCTKVGAPVAVPPQPPVAAPPVAVTTGTTTYTASDSSTFWNGLWSSPGIGWGNPGDVYSGTWGGSTVHGAWFYGGAASQLSGRTIGAARFTFGQRLGGSGNYNAPAQVVVWTHSSANRPGGDITALNSTTVTVQPYDSPTVPLTAAQATDLLNGGGIAIYGGDYAVFQGIQTNPASGQLSFDWSR